MSDFKVRPELPSEHVMVHDVHKRASGSSEKADLVSVLRAEARPPISLVAVSGDEVIGHVLMSPVRIDSEGGATQALMLGPLAVAPEHSERGIERELVSAALEEARAAGHRVVFVVGDADLYAGFGFEMAPPKGLRSEYDVLNPGLMVAELEPGALEGRTGIVRYPSRTWFM